MGLEKIANNDTGKIRRPFVAVDNYIVSFPMFPVLL
jgi:hypothetical protein